ncbi:MAG TPA: hypothetical protein VHD81_00145 [Mycobacteriales bacterium]|nr:hypothetical protein [Mycobacteriales bacterium]
MNSTIWSPGGLDGTYPGNQLVTLSLPTGLPLLPQMTWSPGLSPQLKVNADSKSVVIRSKQTTRTITRFPLPTTSAFPANNGVFTLPDKSGDGSTITDTDTNIGFAITGDWLYYAIQTTEQRTKGQISVGYYNYSTKTKSSPALTSYGFPAGQELEGMTIVGGTTLVVGANLGGGPPKKFSLYKLT